MAWQTGNIITASGLNYLPNTFLFGNASDGNLILASNTIFTKDWNFTTLTINNGYTLDPNGYRILATQSVTNNGTISVNGNAATSSPIPGLARASGSIGGGGCGGSGAFTVLPVYCGGGGGGAGVILIAASVINNNGILSAVGGNGGNASSGGTTTVLGLNGSPMANVLGNIGGRGGASGFGASGGTITTSAYFMTDAINAVRGFNIGGLYAGGTGGGGGTRCTTGYLGGGGGGGGGCIILIYNQYNESGTIQLSGGIGGSGCLAAGRPPHLHGIDGNPGTIKYINLNNW